MTSDAPRSYVLTGAPVILPHEIVHGTEVLVEADSIRAVGAGIDMPSGVPRIRAPGSWIAPGFVDIHTHGALGASFLEATDDAFEVILREQARHGVTTLLPTTSTAPFDAILDTLRTTQRWMQHDHALPEIPGAHVEGPYFASTQVGAQDPSNLRTPDDGSVERLMEHANAIRIVSYAPELPGSIELTKTLVQQGIVAAAGHSEARDRDLQACTTWGLSHAIHLWSAQSTTWREGPHRQPGLLEASLASPHLTGEVIGDGKHLPPTLLRLAHAALGPDRLCVVSDATSGAGLNEGDTFTMGEMSYVVSEGVGMMLDRSSFAGSTTLLGGMIAILASTGIPLVDVVRMASTTPARVIGLDRSLGSIRPGLQADFAILDDHLRPVQTIKRGVPIWTHGKESSS